MRVHATLDPAADLRRPPGAGRALRRSAAAAVAGLAAALSGGCGAILQGSDIGPDGRSRTDARLRQMVAAGHADSALAWLNAEPDRLPGDDVLDHLYFGALAHQAGLYEESSLWLRSANELAEDRYSKSVFRSALSLVANDRVLPYEPGETERLLINYYNAKNHLALDDADGAAVEARRLSILLDRYDDESAPTPLRRAFRAFASAVFAAAGEWNDSDVAARKSSALGPLWRPEEPWVHPVDDAHGVVAVPLAEIVAGLPGAAERGTAETGRLLVVVEHGRVAQLVEETAFLTLDDRDRDHLSHGGRRRVYASMNLARRMAPDAADSDFLAALTEAEADAAREEAEAAREEAEAREKRDRDADSRADDAPAREAPAADGGPPPPPPVLEPAPDDSDEETGPSVVRSGATAGGHVERERSEEYHVNPYVMRIAWATYRRPPERRGTGRTSLLVGDETGAAARLSIDLSGGVMADHRRDQAWAIARAVARSGVKLAITRAIETEAGEKNEAVGRILGAVANAGAVLSERADVRTWALVPDWLELLRLDLPAGEHRIGLSLPTGERVDLGAVSVLPGRTQVRFVGRAD
ncbi:MAG TPA: hypothetical protein VML95_04810 [Longimicrobiales bacterium]|nr:hypothetical protein [Longimicrobiales bacterium]